MRDVLDLPRVLQRPAVPGGEAQLANEVGNGRLGFKVVAGDGNLN